MRHTSLAIAKKLRKHAASRLWQMQAFGMHAHRFSAHRLDVVASWHFAACQLGHGSRNKHIDALSMLSACCPIRALVANSSHRPNPTSVLVNFATGLDGLQIDDCCRVGHGCHPLIVSFAIFKTVGLIFSPCWWRYTIFGAHPFGSCLC